MTSKPNTNVTSALDQIRNIQESQPKRNRCRFAIVLSKLTPEQREGVVLAMQDLEIPAYPIAEFIRGLGFNVSDQSVRRCRRQCDCWRTYVESN